jgi:acyl-CoA thioester hydrolase
MTEFKANSAAHVFPIRVYYEDTDAGGVVYYANYFKFAERARTEMLRELGFPRSGADGSVSFAVRRCAADYIKPAHLDDALEVHTKIRSVGGASVFADQTVKREGDEIARLEVRLACLGAGGRAARMPSALRQALSDFSEQKGQR